MATGLLRCDHCEKIAKQQDAHGWLEVKVLVSKPSPEMMEMMRTDPQMAKVLDAQGITSADLPALIGGDFCTTDCLVKFYEAQRTLEKMETTEDRWMPEREDRWHPPPPPQEMGGI